MRDLANDVYRGSVDGFVAVEAVTQLLLKRAHVDDEAVLDGAGGAQSKSD